MFVGSAVPSAGAVYAVVDLLKDAELLEYNAILNVLPVGAPLASLKLCPPCKISTLKVLAIADVIALIFYPLMVTVT